MLSLPEDLEILPDGPMGDIILKLQNEIISISLFDMQVSFAVGLGDDCFPGKTFGFHFTNIEKDKAAFCRNIENELSEIYWYSQHKCIVLSGKIAASARANLTIISPCIVGYNVSFENLDQIKLVDRVVEDIEASGPLYGKKFGGRAILSNIHVDFLSLEADLILLNKTFIQTLVSHDSALEFHNEGILNNITMINGKLFFNNGSAIIYSSCIKLRKFWFNNIEFFC
jgi:hypothetical protein